MVQEKTPKIRALCMSTNKRHPKVRQAQSERHVIFCLERPHHTCRCNTWMIRHLSNLAQKLLFQDEFSLFVFFASFVCLVVFPANNFLALLAADISNNMPAGSHVTVTWLSRCDIDDIIEEVGLAVLTTKVLRQQVSPRNNRGQTAD